MFNITRIRKVPQRMCVGCNQMSDKKSLIRVVRTPEGEVTFDPVGRKPGRGAYLCATEECLTKAIKAKRLEKALKHGITPEVVLSLTEQIKKIKGVASDAT